ncbi:TldD/PmbA family protein [Clostridium tagluense]|uniref:TldD/PmbA family protein n=1 Tax=Clostridium tagluense TaxID=360422 RepID=UPI001C6F07E0|nr:metallopeptidase TldD-related protein [Clostridium tagluense]MBW9157107.1 TldD/PmbA family protein [Clostridium tagluense]WLC67284.1 TldD/PmbA family protein [Clostridium tagluense]
MLNKVAAYKIIDKVLSKCNYYTMVSIMCKEEGLTRFANSGIHQNVYTAEDSVTITVIHDKKISEVTTNLLSEEGLNSAVHDAEENLKFLPQGDVELPELTSPLEIASEDYDRTLADKFNILNRASLIKSGIDLLDKDYTAAGALSLSSLVICMGNKKNIRRYARIDTVGFNTVVMHKDGASGYAEYVTNKAKELDVVAMFAFAQNKCKMGINPASIEPGSYDVILEPLAVGDLLTYMSFIGFSAKNVRTGTSFLTGKLGKRVFGENITIRDDVRNENTMPLYFDFEGYARTSLNIVENGVAKELSYDVKSAIADNVEPTGHSFGYAGDGGIAVNLVMEGGTHNLKELIKSTKKGLLVSRFHYMNIVDPRQSILTALTRDGLFLIENGEIKGAVKNMRFTESMLHAFNNVTGITTERTKVPGEFGFNYVPTLKIEDFHFTGKTE